MTIIELICSRCGGTLLFDNTRDIGFCEFCGNKILIRQDVNNINVSRDYSSELNRLMDQVRSNLSLRRAYNALRILDEIIKIDPNYSEAYLLRAKAIALNDYTKTGHISIKTDSDVPKNLDKYRMYTTTSIDIQSIYDEYGINYQSFSRRFKEYYNAQSFQSCVELIRLEYKKPESHHFIYFKDHMMKMYDWSYSQLHHPSIIFLGLEPFNDWKMKSIHDRSYEAVSFQLEMVNRLDISDADYDDIVLEFLKSC